VATLCFVLFFHFKFANVALTCSGSLMSHSELRRFSLSIVVSIVDSALPFFFCCHA